METNFSKVLLLNETFFTSFQDRVLFLLKIHAILCIYAVFPPNFRQECKTVVTGCFLRQAIVRLLFMHPFHGGEGGWGGGAVTGFHTIIRFHNFSPNFRLFL